MALTTSTKNTILVMGVITAGALGYLLWQKRKDKTIKGFAVSKLTPQGKFSIYTVSSTLPKSSVDAIINDYTQSTFDKEVGVKGLAKMSEVQVGQEVKIRGGKGLNGKYKVTKKWYYSADPTQKSLIALDLQNVNNDWDGDMSKYTPASGGKRFTVPNGFTVVT